MYVDEVIKRIEAHTGKAAKRSSNSFCCRCPAHDDRSPSLSVAEGADGHVLLTCHAGCSGEDICATLGIKMSDLFPKEKKTQYREIHGCTEYIYTDEVGAPTYKKVRSSGKRFCILSYGQNGKWEKGLSAKRRVLYRLNEVLSAKKRGAQVWLVEGEKDAERLLSEGLVATTPIEGAGSRLSTDYVDQLRGAHVILLYDEDQAGYRRRDQWRDSLLGHVESLKIVALPELEFREKSGLDVSDWFNKGHSIEELLLLVEKAPFVTHIEKRKVGGLTALTLHEFLESEIPLREMIMAPILPVQGLTLLYSKRGLGKTFLCLAIGYAVASGMGLMRWRNDKPSKVLYVDGEMPANLMQERLNLLVCGAAVKLQDASYFRLITPDLQEEGIPDISTERGQRLIEETLGDAKLLILDNLSILASSLQENEADSWAPLQCWLLKLRKEGVSVLIVHHANKSGGQRGTSRREDALDAVTVLKESHKHPGSDGACFEVHIEKARGFFGEDAKPFVATLNSQIEGTLTWSELECEDDLYDEVVESLLAGKSYRDIAKEYKVKKSRVESIVKKAREKGDIPEKRNG